MVAPREPQSDSARGDHPGDAVDSPTNSPVKSSATSVLRAQPDSMLPPASAFSQVLPTESLNNRGRPLGDLRSQLYQIPNWRNAAHVVIVWAQAALIIFGAAWWNHPVGWVLAFLLMGRSFARLSILMHESAHRLLFSHRKINDWVGTWLLSYPAFVPLDIYRRSHMAHHKREFGPTEPDIMLYAGYPITRDSWRRKLRRDALLNSGWKNLKVLLLALKSSRSRGIAIRILSVQLVILLGCWALTGHWWIYFALWLLPWMTVWRVLNRLRAVAEHGGLHESNDRRQTTHDVRQGFWARFWIVPYNTGWHLAHHLDIGVPFSQLPKYHDELVRVGYVQPELTWPSYRALWKHAASRSSGVTNEPSASPQDN